MAYKCQVAFEFDTDERSLKQPTPTCQAPMEYTAIRSFIAMPA